MKYMGSKSRIKKFIVPILQSIINKNNIKVYEERFVGGGNVIDSILCDKKIGSDEHEALIELLKHVQIGGELPKNVPRELYNDVRDNQNTGKYPQWYLGAVGFLSSYNSRYFDGGYAKPVIEKGKLRDYYDEAKRNLLKQGPKFKDIEFICADYRDREILPNSLIYCDPEYEGTKQYSNKKKFNHKEFWEWAREVSKKHIVIVSELQAPCDFKCIWEKEITRTQNNRARQKAVEKLFIYNSNKN